MSEIFYTVIIDVETGEVLERPLTSEELTERKIMQTEFETREAEIQAKTEARQSALVKLAALGLTEEEVAAL